MSQAQKEVFISYAWGGNSEEFVNRLDQAFQEKGITIVRDKRDLGYKGLIKQFMEQIGRGKCVIAVINDKYLKSPNCMFELVQVSKTGKFYDRIFPLVLDDAQIYDPIQRLKYIKYWENKKKELNEAIRDVGAEYLQGIRDEIDQYTEIRNTIAELTSILKNMNTLTPDLHSQSDFEILIQAIEHQLGEMREPIVQLVQSFPDDESPDHKKTIVPEPPSPKRCLVSIKRKSANRESGNSFKVYCNGKLEASISNGSTSSFWVLPGTHSIYIECDGYDSSIRGQSTWTGPYTLSSNTIKYTFSEHTSLSLYCYFRSGWDLINYFSPSIVLEII